MTGEAIGGTILLVLTAAFVLANLVTAYKTQGGWIGQVPVMAPPVFAPVVATFGLVLIDHSTGWPGWPYWGLGLFWVGFTLAAWYATVYAGELGRRRGERDDGEV